MSELGSEFPKARSGPRQARANGSNGNLQCDGRLLVGQLRPATEPEHVLFFLAQLPDKRKHLAHRCLIIEAGISVVAEVRASALAKESDRCLPVAPLRSGSVSDHVGRDPIQPGQHHALRQLDITSPPGLKEDDRKQVLGGGPVADRDGSSSCRSSANAGRRAHRRRPYRLSGQRAIDLSRTPSLHPCPMRPLGSESHQTNIEPRSGTRGDGISRTNTGVVRHNPIAIQLTQGSSTIPNSHPVLSGAMRRRLLLLIIGLASVACVGNGSAASG